jgi:endonuclease-3
VPFPIDRVLDRLRREVKHLDTPVVALAAQVSRDPFEILVACLLSLRTQDRTTAGAVKRLFARARTPEAILGLDDHALEELIYPVGFYRTKARTLKAIAGALLADHGGEVPGTLDALLELPGVGRKTANLVVTQAFRKPGICVDTHVHRIANRWGYVRTRDPHETEMALREKLPRRHWRSVNETLVAFGQAICRPTSPRCSLCPVAKDCARVGVTRSR